MMIQFTVENHRSIKKTPNPSELVQRFLTAIREVLRQ